MQDQPKWQAINDLYMPDGMYVVMNLEYQYGQVYPIMESACHFDGDWYQAKSLTDIGSVQKRTGLYDPELSKKLITLVPQICIPCTELYETGKMFYSKLTKEKYYPL